ncbi:MAG: tRNA (adenosine(37)-N6)-dimethylallyltransferase MiaA [Candidatus Nanopelagicales bacterium]
MADREWPTVLAIVGPTAVGKSAVAVEVARAMGAEVVNADAYQVYRGLDIGTAKIRFEQRGGVPHHLLDIVGMTETLGAADFQRRGREVLRELARRGTGAVVVGGSGLYVRALLDDLRFPGSDPEIRRRWEQELADVGPVRLHAVLAQRDPAAASAILSTNGRRIVRALEVGELTGQGFTATLAASGPELIPHESIGLDLPRPALDERIAERVDQMFAAGFVAEVRGLIHDGLREGRTASRALGYPQVIALIEGRLTQDEARTEIIAATRRYARRQQRWFRRDLRTTWIDAREGLLSTVASILARRSAEPTTLGP